jgi:adenine-specific DNA-methyltransferase
MTIEKLDASTPDLTRQNIERLLELFPECRTEGSRDDAPMVDFDLLRQALSDYLVEGPAERYRLDWPGKRQALLTANTPIEKTLRPMRDESVDFDTTRNLFIVGDNLDALKLLQETYLGKVKMIYIDPPYNTGNDFIYKDNFTLSRDEYADESGQRDEEGGRLVANPDSRGRFHSDWLSMIYSRLKIAKNFLEDNGSIFISIDDSELDNLLKISDEIFGSDNFLSMFVWEKRTSRENRKVFSVNQDYLVAYAKDRRKFETQRGSLPYTDEVLARYSNPDDDRRGDWQSVAISVQGGHGTKSQFYDITTPSGRLVSPPSGLCWRFTEAKLKELIADNRIWFGADGGNVPRMKLFLNEMDQGLTPHTLWRADEVGTTDKGKREVNALFDGNSVFETPKPTSLIRRVLEIASSSKDGIFMDFFGGSGSTADAVMQQNAQDGGHRNFVIVQLAETSPEDSEAAKAGYADISALAAERIRRAGKKIAAENPSLFGKLDTGFRAFRIASGNFVDINVTPKEATQQALAGMVSHIKDDRSEEDLLFGALLRWGVDITLSVEQRDLVGRNVWLVDAPEDGSGVGAALIACFARPDSNGKNGIDTELADAMAELAPLRVLFRDDGFADDATKENVHSRFKQRAPDTQVRVL